VFDSAFPRAKAAALGIAFPGSLSKGRRLSVDLFCFASECNEKLVFEVNA